MAVWIRSKNEENICDFDKGLDVLLQLKPRRFKWKDEFGGQEEIGFIAQEVDEVYTEVVDKPDIEYNVVPAYTDEKSGDTFEAKARGLMGLDYSKFCVLLVKSVQELSAKVTALEAQIN